MKLENLPKYKVFQHVSDERGFQTIRMMGGCEVKGRWIVGRFVDVIEDDGSKSIGIVHYVRSQGSILRQLVGSRNMNNSTICMETPFESTNGMTIYELDVIENDNGELGLVVNGEYGDEHTSHVGWHIEYLSGWTQAMNHHEKYNVVTDAFYTTDHYTNDEISDKVKNHCRLSPTTISRSQEEIRALWDAAKQYTEYKVIPI